MKKTFKAKLVGRGPKGAWTFLTVPFSVEKTWGTRARLSVKGTINGKPFRNSLMPEGDGTHSMMVNKTLQKAAGAGAGETVRVTIEPDKAPRRVAVPAGLEAALAKNRKASDFFAGLSYSAKKAYTDWIAGAKKEETRERRIARAVVMLAQGKKNR
ncbi:MAG: YdeI/OmpD-associated family protein [Acidobacteriota bacterium]